MGCEYCKDELYLQDYNCLWKKHYPFGKRADLRVRILMFAPSKEDENDKKWQLNFEVGVGGYIEDDIVDEYITIHYCPFCGRKLD